MQERPVYRALNKPMTILGVERKMFFSIVLVSFSLFHLSEALIPAVVLFLVLVAVARVITQSDPQSLRVVLNSHRFATRYDPALREEGDEHGG